MGRDWIIDVLADLRSFACNNDLPMLGAQLEEAELVAQVEIASGFAPEKRHHRSDNEPATDHGAKTDPPRRT